MIPSFPPICIFSFCSTLLSCLVFSLFLLIFLLIKFFFSLYLSVFFLYPFFLQSLALHISLYLSLCLFFFCFRWQSTDPSIINLSFQTVTIQSWIFSANVWIRFLAVTRIIHYSLKWQNSKASKTPAMNTKEQVKTKRTKKARGRIYDPNFRNTNPFWLSFLLLHFSPEYHFSFSVQFIWFSLWTLRNDSFLSFHG